MKKVPLPEWCVSVKKAMVERDDMSVTELAKEIGYSRAHVSQVIMVRWCRLRTSSPRLSPA